MSNSPTDSRASSLVDAVQEDPGLQPIEKETQFRFGKTDDRVRVFSDEAGIIRRLLQHPEFCADSLRIYHDEENPSACVQPEGYEAGMITAVWGYIPIGALKVQACSRSTSEHARIVSRRSDDGE